MFGNIKKIFFKPKRSNKELTLELISTPNSGVLDDKDFGIIQYFQPSRSDGDGIWQMTDEWEYSKYLPTLSFSSSSILGDISGPYELAKEFLVSKNKQENLKFLWELSNLGLREQIERWHPRHVGKNPQEIFYLSNIAINTIEDGQVALWEATFLPKNETIELKKDIFTNIYIKFNHEKYVGTSCDT